MGSPHLEEELIGGDCRSRSPLPNPSKICKNHRREGRGIKLKRFNNGGERYAQEHTRNPKKPLGRRPLLYGKPNMAVGVISHFFGWFLVQPDQNRAYRKIVLKLFSLNSVQFSV
jgi:hypothetical protein